MIRFVRTAVFSALILVALVPDARAATDIQKVISPGGIEAWLVQDSSVPIVSMRFDFDAGSSFDPENRPGLSAMLSNILTKGAGDLDEQSFQRQLNDRSISMDFSAYSDNFYGSLTTLSPRKDEAFNLLKLALNEPRFDEQPLTRLQDQFVASIEEDQKQGNWIARQFLNRMMYGDHPYAHNGQGTVQSVRAMTADDLRGFMRDRLARDTLLVAVVGDITPEELAPALDDIFGGLPATSTGAVPAVGTVPDQGRLVLIEQDLPQSIVSIGQKGVDRKDPDWFAASIANYILGGGGFQSRLMVEARVKRGLTYGVYSVLRPAQSFDVLLSGGSTKNETAAEFIEVVKAEWQRFAEEGPTDDEIERAKGYLIGSFALSMTTTSDIADVVLAIRESDLGIDYIDRRSAEIEAVTRDDIMRVVGDLLTPDALRIVVVGKPEGIEADRVVPLGADILEALDAEPVSGS